MSPQPLSVDAAAIAAWVGRLWWPVLRISGFIATAPLLGMGAVPRMARIALTVALAALLAPVVRTPAGLTALSAAGLLTAAREFLAGAAIGLVVSVTFEAMAVAGQTIAITKGLAFATAVDPQHGASTTVIGQMFTLFALLTYLSMNGHLMLIAALAHSFETLPIAAAPLDGGLLRAVALWGGHLFETGLLIALPVVVALLVINMALGVVTRAAPQLNLLGVGFPLTLMAGFVILTLSLDATMGGIARIVGDALDAAGGLVAAHGARTP